MDELRTIQLTVGAGDGISNACLMTASNMLIGKPESLDNATCQCTTIRAFVVPTNDKMGKYSRKLLCELYGPLAWEIIGTQTDDPAILRARGFAWADWAVREIAPIALRAVGLTAQAETLERLPAIVDKETASAAADAAADPVSRANSQHAMPIRSIQSRRRAVAASAAADAAASAAADAAASAAADAAADAAANAAANAANAADAETIWRKCPEIIRRVAAIGDKRPVEVVMSREQLCEVLR